MNKKYLIINADDFGLHESSDRAIVDLFEKRLISSATILAPSKNARQACELSAERNYAVGLHWTLLSERISPPWRPSAPNQEVQSLTNVHGNLPFENSSIRKNARGQEVSRELLAQYDFLLGCGCKPDHADSHSGSLYGINGRMFFMNAFRLCREKGLPFRFPKTDGFLRRQFAGRLPLPLSAALKGIARYGQRMGVALLDDFLTHPQPIAKISNYESLCTYYETQLATLPTGICEVFLHPALPDEEMRGRTREWQKREWEYRFLAEGRLAEAAEKQGFEIVSWGIFKDLNLV